MLDCLTRPLVQYLCDGVVAGPVEAVQVDALICEVVCLGSGSEGPHRPLTQLADNRRKTTTHRGTQIRCETPRAEPHVRVSVCTGCPDSPRHTVFVMRMVSLRATTFVGRDPTVQPRMWDDTPRIEPNSLQFLSSDQRQAVQVDQPTERLWAEAGRLEARPVPLRAIPAAPELPAQAVILKLAQLVGRQRLHALVEVPVRLNRHHAEIVASARPTRQRLRLSRLTVLS